MSVIVELQVAAEAFELGRILEISPGTRIEMETMVPAGDRSVPLFWVYDADAEAFETHLRDHPGVNSITRVDLFEDRALYALDWRTELDHLFAAVVGTDGSIMAATGYTDRWQFEIRFPSYDALSAFKSALGDANVPFEVIRVYNPTKPDAGPWYGLTPNQREALVMAVEAGYYDIPRACTTLELAEKLDISDQAVTERLRRALVNLVSYTLLVPDESE
jgi:predicted DNA binding protein